MGKPEYTGVKNPFVKYRETPKTLLILIRKTKQKKKVRLHQHVMDVGVDMYVIHGAD